MYSLNTGCLMKHRSRNFESGTENYNSS